VRILLSIALAACLPAPAQPGRDVQFQLLLAEAHQAQARGDCRAAAGAYTKALAIRPDLAELWSNLGLIQYQSHEYAQAEQAFRRAIGINKSLFVPNLFLGLDLLELKRRRQSVQYLLAAERLNPQDAQVPLALGRAFHLLLDPTRSREWYQRATDLAPRSSEAWYGLGVAYLELDKSAGERSYQKLGVAALTRAGELEPESPRIHALLGAVYQQQQMFGKARDEYSKILALEPDNIAGLAGLAAAYLHDGHLDQAQAAARKALASDPEDSDINLLMGEILVERHDYSGAELCLKRSLYARPELVPRAHALLGRVFARTGRPQQAINELKQGLASDDDGSVYYQLARLYQSSGDTKAAATAFEKSEQIRAKHDTPVH